MKIKLSLIIILLICVLPLDSKNIIYAEERGIVPDTGEDMLPALRTLFAEVAEEGISVEIRFKPGKYHLFSDRASDKSIIKTTGVLVEGADSLSIDGCGAEFVGHGALSPFVFIDCKNLRVKNLVFDWERPLITQGKILTWNSDYVDIGIDRSTYPYRISDGKALFYGDDWEAPVSERSYSTIYDQNGNVLQGTKDYFLSRENVLFRGRAEEVAENVIRFYGKPDTYVAESNRIALYHGLYCGSIFTLKDCSDVLLSNIDIYHSPGMGVWGVRCEDVCLDDVNVVTRSGRCFSGIADALHFSHCRGKIVLINSRFGGQGDDALNVHGRYYLIKSISQDRMSAVMEVTRGAVPEIPQAGENVWFIKDGLYMLTETASVAFATQTGDGTVLLGFTAPLHEDISPGCYIENADWIPDLEVAGCCFEKSNRARGILFTTSGKVKIHCNHFFSAGSAILIEGDTNYWFESGPVRNVEIYDNHFIDCATSVRDSITHWGWGEAVITVTPSHRPENETEKRYHSGITVRDNVFEVFDGHVIYARSVDGLKFHGNKVVKTASYKPVLWNRYMFTFEGCRHVDIGENDFDSIYLPLEVITVD